MRSEKIDEMQKGSVKLIIQRRNNIFGTKQKATYELNSLKLRPDVSVLALSLRSFE